MTQSSLTCKGWEQSPGTSPPFRSWLSHPLWPRGIQPRNAHPKHQVNPKPPVVCQQRSLHKEMGWEADLGNSPPFWRSLNLLTTVPGCWEDRMPGNFSKFLAPAQVWKWPILSLILNKDRERKRWLNRENENTTTSSSLPLLITFWAKRALFSLYHQIDYLHSLLYCHHCHSQFTDEKREAQQD